MDYLFGGPQPENENEDPAVAVEEACAAYGEFLRNEDGTIKYEDFLIFHAIVVRQTTRMYRPKKQEL